MGASSVSKKGSNNGTWPVFYVTLTVKHLLGNLRQTLAFLADRKQVDSLEVQQETISWVGTEPVDEEKRFNLSITITFYI
jgi:hypothetical protein